MVVPIKVLKGTISLQVLKLFELLVPLVTLPLVLDRFGSHLYGNIALSQVVAIYFIMVLDWGYNSIGAKIYLELESKIEQCYFLSLSLLIKVLALFLSLFAFYYFLLLNNVSSEIIIYTSMYIITSVLSPTWVLQAEYKLHYQAIISGISRGAFLFVVVFYNELDIFLSLYLFFLYLPQFLIFIFSLVYSFIKVDFRIFINSISEHSFSCNRKLSLGYFFRQGWNVTSFRLFSASFNPLLTVYINHYIGPSSVAVFSIVQKVNNAAIGILTPLVQSSFPLLAEKVKSDFKKFIRTALAIYGLIICLFFLFYLSLCFVMPYIINMTGFTHLNFEVIMLTSSFVVIFSVLSSLSSHLLILLNRTRLIKYTVALSGSAMFLAFYILEILDMYNLVFIFTISQAFLCGMLLLVVIRSLNVK